MVETLLSADRSLFLALNGLHAPWLDQVMYWASNPLVWLPLFVFLFYFVIRAFHFKTATVLVGVVLMITVSDQLANLSKNNLKRLRPSHESKIADSIHIVNEYRGEDFSFYSAHASNTFALAVFLIVLFQKRYRYLYLLLVGWASLMSYTRIYLGVHYPLDIICGALAGCLLGYLTGRITLYFIGLQGREINPA
ncbi:MAG: phosphatase PAP2 family protein [Bacteroidota bacterium]|jgi:undecaprenyl-diphosphatase